MKNVLISLVPVLKRGGPILLFFHLKFHPKMLICSDYLKNKGFYLALWKNKLRVSPHIYNTSQEIEGLLAALNNYGAK